MAIEIGSLVVRGSFGEANDSDEKIRKLQNEILEMRARMLIEVQDMIAESDRRRQER